MADTSLRLRGLVLSAYEIKELTDWPDAMVEDYLNILESLITLADEIDVKNDIIKNTNRVVFADSPYEIRATDEEVFFDTDGGPIVANLLPGVDGRNYRLINVGGASNDVTLNPFGTELLFGVNASERIADDEVLLMTFETVEGWY